MRKRRILCFILTAVLLLGMLPTAFAAGGTRYYDWAYEIFDGINEARVQNGVAPLTMDETMLECAMTRAEELSRNYGHTRPNGLKWYTVYSSNPGAMGENIGYGYTSAQDAHQKWLNSREHRKNILNPDYVCCGVGMVEVGGTVYGVELFGDASCLTRPVSGNSPAPTGTQTGNQNSGNSNNTNNTSSNDWGNAVLSFITGLFGGQSSSPSANASTPSASGVAGFRDVPANSYYADAVTWGVGRGIVRGTGANTFSPNDSCTRGQIVTFLWRAAGSPQVSSSSPFTDVRSSDYCFQACLWAARQGVAQGTGANTFSPNRTCTRAEAVTFLWRAAGAPSVGGNSGFSDVPAYEYYAAAVTWAHQNGIAEGTSSTAFSPNQTCTRAQIIEFIYRWKT